MILTCPACSAKFMISSEALGAGGREVRCGKCQQRWFQAGERDSLDELSEHQHIDEDLESAIDKINDEEDDIEVQFTPHIDPPASFPKSFQQPKPEVEETIKTLPKTKSQHVAGAMVALAVVSVLAYGFVAAKESLTKTFPFLETTYSSLGYALPKGPPEVSFDRLKIVKSGEKATGSGYIINLTEKTVSVPALGVDLLSVSREVLATKKVDMPQKTLKAESSEKIEFSFDKIPAGAQSVRVYTTK